MAKSKEELLEEFIKTQQNPSVLRDMLTSSIEGSSEEDLFDEFVDPDREYEEDEDEDEDED